MPKYRTRPVLVLIVFFFLLPWPAAADFAQVTLRNDISGKVVRPGELVEFSFTIEKGYNTSESVSVMLFLGKLPENWNAGFYAEGDQISHITLPKEARQKKEVILKISVPKNVKDGNYPVLIGLQPYGENIRNYDRIHREFAVTVDRNAMPNLELFSDVPGKITHPGLPVRFKASIENKYESRANIMILLVSKPPNWGVNLLAADGSRITKLGVPAKETRDFEVLVHPPVDAVEGEFEIQIAACPEKGNKSVFLPLSVNINPELAHDEALSAYLEIEAEIVGLDIRPEDTAEFTVSLKNRYDQPLKLDLEILSLPEEWKAEFITEEDREGRLASVRLPEGAEQEFTVKVKPSPNATGGRYPIIVAAVCGGKKVTRQLEVGINKNIENEEILEVYASSRELVLNPGSSTEIRVTIKNCGDEELEDVRLEINNVNGISTQIRSFGTIEKLDSGESSSIPVEITANANAGSGVKEIFMRAKNDDFLSPEQSIKINVEKSSSSGLLGLGMLGFAGLVLVFVIRKFGRR